MERIVQRKGIKGALEWGNKRVKVCLGLNSKTSRLKRRMTNSNRERHKEDNISHRRHRNGNESKIDLRGEEKLRKEKDGNRNSDFWDSDKIIPRTQGNQPITQ